MEGLVVVRNYLHIMLRLRLQYDREIGLVDSLNVAVVQHESHFFQQNQIF